MQMKMKLIRFRKRKIKLTQAWHALLPRPPVVVMDVYKVPADLHSSPPPPLPALVPHRGPTIGPTNQLHGFALRSNVTQRTQTQPTHARFLASIFLVDILSWLLCSSLLFLLVILSYSSWLLSLAIPVGFNS